MIMSNEVLTESSSLPLSDKKQPSSTSVYIAKKLCGNASVSRDIGRLNYIGCSATPQCGSVNTRCCVEHCHALHCLFSDYYRHALSLGSIRLSINLSWKLYIREYRRGFTYVKTGNIYDTDGSREIHPIKCHQINHTRCGDSTSRLSCLISILFLQTMINLRIQTNFISNSALARITSIGQ